MPGFLDSKEPNSHSKINLNLSDFSIDSEADDNLSNNTNQEVQNDEPEPNDEIHQEIGNSNTILLK